MEWCTILLALTVSDKLQQENETAAELCCLRQSRPYFSWVPNKWPILCAELRYRGGCESHTKQFLRWKGFLIKAFMSSFYG